MPTALASPPRPTTTASARPRVLYLAHRVPYPPDKGDRIRTYHTIRTLAERADVDLIALADEPVTDDTRSALNDLCGRVAVVPVGGASRYLRMAGSAARGRSLSEGAFGSPDVARLLRAWRSDADYTAAVGSSSAVFPYLLSDDLRGVRTVVDLIDVDSRKWADFAASAAPPKRWLYRYEANRVRALERAIASRADAVTVVSRAEADVLDAFTGPGTAIVAGNGVDLDYFAPADVDESPAVAFVGAMDYWPNVDAVTWFADTVWPEIRRKHPTAEFRIVGRSPTAEVRRLADRPGIVVTGAVADVRPHVASAAVVVAPVRIARGVQNKVLEALAMGKASVVAPPPLAALDVVVGRDLLRADTPGQWVTAVCHLLADPARRRDLGTAGRRYVETHHTWAACLAPLTDAVLAPAPVS